MSGFDLNQQEIDNRTARMPARTGLEPGAFDNFLAGTGKVTMQTLAKAGSAIDLLGSVGPIVQDKFTGGTEAQDRYFQEHEEVFGNAVDYWTPKPNEVGAAGQVVGQLLGTLPLVFASPGLAVGATQVSTAEDLAKKGVDPLKAQAAGAVQAAGLGLGIWVPILGKTLAQRVLLGGAGFNAVQGVATRGASGAILEGTPGAEDFKAFDPTSLTLDVLLGAAFGGIAHVSPAMRAEGAAWQSKLADWGAKLKPSEVDALITMRQAQHINADSMPGKPVDMADADAHVQRLRQAIDDLANDRPISVEQMPPARFEIDPARQAEAEAEAAKVQADVAEVLRAEVEPKVGDNATAARPDFDQFARQYVESQPVDKFDHAQRIADAEAEIRNDYMLGNKDGSQFFEQLNEEDAARFFDEDGDLTDAGHARYTELQDGAVAREARDQIGEPQKRPVDFSDPADAAQVLRDYLDAAGLDPNIVGGSGKSRSKYFEIENGKRLIRVSDHELPDHYVNDSDIEVLLPHDSDAALAKIKAVASEIVASREGAATTSVDPDNAGSRSQIVSRNEMQERPAVRADESGSLEEPAQSGGVAGSDANVSRKVGADTTAANGPAIDPWNEPQAPRTFDQRMGDKSIRVELLRMKGETGWAEVGGRMIRQQDEAGNETITRTAWVPNAEWWPGRPKGLKETDLHKAIDKAVAGEKLNPAERRAVEYMVDVADQRQKSAEWKPTGDELAETGLASHNELDAAMTARAAEINPDAVEALAVRFESDDAGFMRGIKELLDEHDSQTAANRQTDQRAPETAAGQPGTVRPEEVAATGDPIAAEAQRFTAENPDVNIVIGKTADGEDITTTPRQMMEDAGLAVEQARADATLFEVAASCLLGAK